LYLILRVFLSLFVVVCKKQEFGIFVSQKLTKVDEWAFLIYLLFQLLELI
jgi:hypothetical protein